MTISLTDIEHNSALRGGGIWNGEGRSILVRESTIRDNGAMSGGGIYNDGGTVRIRRDSLISQNVASVDSGGGIFSSDGLVTVVDSDLIANQAELNGGGIAVEAGQSFVARADVHGNSAGSEANPGSGGGIYHNSPNIAFAGRSGIQDSTIRDNTASDSGGGLFVGDGIRVNIKASTFRGNSANGEGGGGLYSNARKTLISGTDFIGNFATSELGGSGGGLYVSVTSSSTGAGLTMENSIVELNAAIANGGGLYLEGGRNQFVDSTFRYNRALFNSQNPIGRGGGIHSTAGAFGAETSFQGGSFHRNSASHSGGGLYVIGEDAISNHWSFFRGSTLIQENRAFGGNQGNGGGGIYVQNANVGLENATFDANSASGDFASGGAILTVDDASVSLTGVVAIDNTATLNGGFWASDSSRQSISDSVLRGNEAFNGDGGAVYYAGDSDRSTSLFNSQVLRNSAGGSGGGLYRSTAGIGLGELEVVGTVFRSNTAGLNGGGLAFRGVGAEIDNSIVSQNVAGQDGGGVHIEFSNRQHRLLNLQISENESLRGAAIFNDGVLRVERSVVSSNTASQEGGGILDGDNGTTEAIDTIFVDNLPES